MLDERGSKLGSRLWRNAATALLVLVGGIYLANGLSTLLAPDFGGDLRTRWRERNYLSAGIDPYDVSVQFGGMNSNPAERGRIAEHKSSGEPYVDPSGYPPWGLAAEFLFIPPGPLKMAQAAFAILNLLALGLMCGTAFALGRPQGGGALMAASAFAMFGNASTLRLGQYGLILNGFLVLYFWASARKSALGSGSSMAFAAIKPSFSAYQVGLMVVRRQWLGLTLVALFCAAASLVPWMLTGVAPVEMIQQMFRQSAYVSEGGTSLLQVALLFVPYNLAAPALGLFGLAITLILGWRYRDFSPLVAISIAAVLGRICFYHRQYDNVMLVFPLLALGLLALRRANPWAWFAFAIYGLTLWIPLRYYAYGPPTIIALSILWCAGLFVICRYAEYLPALTIASRR